MQPSAEWRKTKIMSSRTAAQPDGLRMLRLSARNLGEVDATTMGTILVDVNDFQQDKTEYSF